MKTKAWTLRRSHPADIHKVIKKYSRRHGDVEGIGVAPHGNRNAAVAGGDVGGIQSARFAAEEQSGACAAPGRCQRFGVIGQDRRHQFKSALFQVGKRRPFVVDAGDGEIENGAHRDPDGLAEKGVAALRAKDERRYAKSGRQAEQRAEVFDIGDFGADHQGLRIGVGKNFRQRL